MTAHVEDRPHPDPPRMPIGPFVAVALELGMLSVFVYERAIVGVIFWLAYLWFSATWHLLIGAFDKR